MEYWETYYRGLLFPMSLWLLINGPFKMLKRLSSSWYKWASLSPTGPMVSSTGNSLALWEVTRCKPCREELERDFISKLRCPPPFTDKALPSSFRGRYPRSPVFGEVPV